MEIQIKICTDRELWDNLLKNSEYNTPFHTWAWLTAMEKYSTLSFLRLKLKAKLYPLIGYNGEEAVGVFPVFLYGAGIYRVVLSPPAGVEVPELGPLIVSQTKLKEGKREALFLDFYKQADAFIFGTLKASYCSIVSAPGMINARPFKWTGYKVEPLYAYFLDLAKGEEKLLADMDSDFCQGIKAAEAKVTIREGTRNDLDLLFPLGFKGYDGQDLQANASKEYLADLFAGFPNGNLKLFVAEEGGVICAGSLLAIHGKRMVAWILAAKAGQKDVPLADILQWHQIKWGMQNRFREYELPWTNDERICKDKSCFDPMVDVYFSAKKYSSVFAEILDSSISFINAMFSYSLISINRQ